MPVTFRPWSRSEPWPRRGGARRPSVKLRRSRPRIPLAPRGSKLIDIDTPSPSGGRGLTERQRREVEYHRERAKEFRRLVDQPVSYDIISPDVPRRWWNAYWTMFTCLLALDVRDKRVLIVGCGFGEDAFRVAKMGARVDAIDLSDESIEIARAIAAREELDVDFRVLPAENLGYEDDTFDLVIARDILHHVDIPEAMREIVRVTKPDGVFLFNEIYTHSLSDRIRTSWLVDRFVYPLLQDFIYGEKGVYITEDERKLTERDIQAILRALGPREITRYFYIVVTRLLPERYTAITKLDRIVTKLVGPLGALLAGRVIVQARVRKH